MDSITVCNYRCFGEEQTARLAPITLLVGENSSGKTSLMAMIRALWDSALADRVPDFKEEPYDLGSFDEIAHHRGASGGRAKSFLASFDLYDPDLKEAHELPYKLEVEFGSQHAAPKPVRRRVQRGDYWLEQDLSSADLDVRLGTRKGEWRRRDTDTSAMLISSDSDFIPPFEFLLWNFRHSDDKRVSLSKVFEAVGDSPQITRSVIREMQEFLTRMPRGYRFWDTAQSTARPFASAPTRSQPRRTYDPARVAPDAEGDYVPTYLAWLSLHDPDAWKTLKERLEAFGHAAGLFDEINVRRLGKTATHPFQIQVRKFDKKRKGPPRNLADVGYGVSQILPLVTELLRDEGPQTALLQQPEVHLHPSAAAALGTLLCQLAADRTGSRRLIVETHSDFIIDRVRSAVPDESIGLGTDDVSIVYFERRGLEVYMHSMNVDESGNIVRAPDGYRDFFTRELQRSLKL